MTRLRPRRLQHPPAAVLTIAVPVALAAALAAVDLSTRSLWLDEGASVAIASSHGGALWRAIGHDGGNMLVYYALLHVVIGLFGTAEAVIRLPSLVAAAATAGLTAALGLRLTGERRVALAAGTLSAVSLPLVFWGQDARGYALMVALVTASFLALAHVLDAPARRPAPRGALLAYGLATVLALYVGFDAVLAVAAQLTVLAIARHRARAVLVTLALVALACIPLVVLAVDRGSGQLFWVPSLSGAVLRQAGLTLASSGMPPNFADTAVALPAAIITGLLVLVALSAGRRPPLVVAWLLVPIALMLAASVAGEPIELSRAGTLLIPAVALLLAGLLAGPRLPLLAAWGAVAVVLALRAVPLVDAYGVSPEDWRAAARYILAAARPGDCVAFYPQDGRMPFDYYVRRAGAAAGATTPRPVLPDAPWATVRPYVERYRVPRPARLEGLAARCRRLWLLASHEGQRHGPPASRRNFRGYRRLVGGLARRYPHRVARRFGYAAVVRVTRFSR